MTTSAASNPSGLILANPYAMSWHGQAVGAFALLHRRL